MIDFAWEGRGEPLTEVTTAAGESVSTEFGATIATFSTEEHSNVAQKENVPFGEGQVPQQQQEQLPRMPGQRLGQRRAFGGN